MPRAIIGCIFTAVVFFIIFPNSSGKAARCADSGAAGARP
jgi:hypothetical protein